MSLDPQRTEKILQAAATVFCEVGYSRASMDRIARQADVSKATLYNHFPSKSALFRTAVQRASESLVNDLNRMELSGLALPEALERLGGSYLAFLLDDTRLAVIRAVVAESQHDSELGRTFHEVGPAIAQAAVARLLKRRVEAGELAVTDVNSAARDFLALLRGDLLWRALLRVDFSGVDRTTYLREVVTQFLDGCRRPLA